MNPTQTQHPDNAQHTPTPWHVSPLDSSRYMVCHDDGFVIATVSPEGNRTLANAKFIVRAVNNHAGLLAALERLADECQLSRKYIVISEDEGFAAYNATAEAVIKARAALASAPCVRFLTV
jgi:hypothetical protein